MSLVLRPHSLNHRGFSLTEMMVVLVIISVLTSMVVPMARNAAGLECPGTVASHIGGIIERSRLHAMSRSTKVWVRVGPSVEVTRGLNEPSTLAVSVWESLDGSGNPSSTWRRTWRPAFFKNFSLAADLPTFGNRPHLDPSAKPDVCAWILIDPAGEMRLLETAASSPAQAPPAGQPRLFQLFELGIQPTRQGRVSDDLRNNTAAVQFTGLTGSFIVFEP